MFRLSKPLFWFSDRPFVYPDNVAHIIGEIAMDNHFLLLFFVFFFKKHDYLLANLKKSISLPRNCKKNLFHIKRDVHSTSHRQKRW